MTQKPPYIETLFEKGMLLESEAAAGKGTWSTALRHWEDLTKKMERMRPRPASYFDAWYHVAWVLYQQKETAKAKQALLGVMRLSPSVGGPEMKAKYQALAREAQMKNGDRKMARRLAIQPRSCNRLSSLMAAACGDWLVRLGPRRRCQSDLRDDVQAGDRRTRQGPGAIRVAERSRGLAGCDRPRACRPTRSSRSATMASRRAFHWPRPAKPSGQLAEAAELFKKAATESAGKPFPLQAAQFREAEVLTELAMVEPDRVKEAKDKLSRFLRAYPTSRHLAAARDCQARLQLHAGDFAGAEAAIAELAKLPRGAERAAVLRTRVLGKQGKHAEAITQLDKLIATASQGLGTTTRGTARQGREPRGAQTIQGSGNTITRGDPGEPARRRGRPGPRLQHPGRLPSGGQSSQGRPVRLSAHRLALQ